MQKPQNSRTPWPLIGMLLTLTAFAFSGNVIPPLITTIAEEAAVDFTRFGYVVMVQYFSFFVACLFGGWLCEHRGVNNRLIVLIGLGILTLTFFAGTQLTTLTGFIIWSIPLGFGGGLVEAFSTVMISNREKPGSARLLNLSQVFFCLGAMGAPLVTAILLYRNMSWKIIFLVLGWFIFGVFCVFLAATRNERVGRGPVEHPRDSKSSPLYRDRLFILLSIMLFTYVTFESMMASWIAAYFEEKLASSAPAAAMRLVFFWGGLIAGRLAAAVLPVRYSLWPVMFSGVALMVVTAAAASFFLTPMTVTVLIFLHGLAIGPLWPTIVAIAKSARNRDKFTSSVIAYGAIGVSVGSGLGSVIIKVADARLFFPTVAIGGLFLFYLCVRTHRRFSGG